MKVTKHPDGTTDYDGTPEEIQKMLGAPVPVYSPYIICTCGQSTVPACPLHPISYQPVWIGWPPSYDFGCGTPTYATLQVVN